MVIFKKEILIENSQLKHKKIKKQDERNAYSYITEKGGDLSQTHGNLLKFLSSTIPTYTQSKK